ncbi:MAG: putative toxin-antitoxin system toxin component, PIN family [Armatimonadetes bacterium]|nr:putative toxin-antitoxin system toxin component, PIN family [Armatimonadota bacterium]
MCDARQVLALRIIVRRPEARLVLDTNFFVAAFWRPHGTSARILAACEEDRFVLLYSPAIRGELVRILRQARTTSVFQERIEELLSGAEEIHPRRSLRLVMDDPDDDKFLECAVEGRADYILTSDVHLLGLGSVEGVSIWTPARFAREYR